MDYGVTMKLQKKLFREPGKSFPHWLKITFWNELGRLAQKCRIAILKNFFPNVLSNTFFPILFQIWE